MCVCGAETLKAAIIIFRRRPRHISSERTPTHTSEGRERSECARCASLKEFSLRFYLWLARLWHRITANSSQSTIWSNLGVAHCLPRYFITSTKFSIFPIMRSKSNVRVLCALTHSVGCYLFSQPFFSRSFFFFHHRRHRCELVFVMPSFRLDSSVINSFLRQQRRL